MGGAVNSAQLLLRVRDLYSRHPEMYDLEPWELQSALFVLGYTDEIADEETVSRAMLRAFRRGDAVLELAAYHECIERGLSEVGDEYRERYPKAAEAWNVYVKDRRAAESREHILAGALLKTQDA
jgi:hypothetical protein